MKEMRITFYVCELVVPAIRCSKKQCNNADIRHEWTWSIYRCLHNGPNGHNGHFLSFEWHAPKSSRTHLLVLGSTRGQREGARCAQQVQTCHVARHRSYYRWTRKAIHTAQFCSTWFSSTFHILLLFSYTFSRFLCLLIFDAPLEIVQSILSSISALKERTSIMLRKYPFLEHFLSLRGHFWPFWVLLGLVPSSG